MRFQVIHTTRYLYDRPVFLEPHVLRLRPRSDPFQQLQHFALTLRPQPTGFTESVDLDGNASALAWFENLTAELRITARSTVDTLLTNPFNFIVTEPAVVSLPARYSPPLAAWLGACLQTDPHAGSIDPLVRDVLAESGRNVMEYLPRLCQRVHEICRSSIRHEGAPYPAAETFERREGACRDLAVLFIEACRRSGLAARFVAGYHEARPDVGPRQLHAWAEVYLPGAGWRGFDPSIGLAVSDRHVALAAGAAPEAAATVTGTLRGTGACSSMYAEVRIEFPDPEADDQSFPAPEDDRIGQDG